MSLPFRRIRPVVLALVFAGAGRFAFGEDALDLAQFVAIVQRAHPAAAERAGLEQAAKAEQVRRPRPARPGVRALVGSRPPD